MWPSLWTAQWRTGSTSWNPPVAWSGSRWTGGIFLPRRSTEALLGGHNTAAAAAIVRAQLVAHEEWPERLRWIVLAAADELFRSLPS
jgi:hypothetical protein